MGSVRLASFCSGAVFVAALLLVHSVPSRGALTRQYANQRTLDADNSLILYWEPDSVTNPTTLRMGLKGNIRGYISVGWSSGTMTNLDIIMCYVDATGTGYIGDFWVSGHNQPALDPDQTFTEVSVGRAGAELWCEFDRPYDNAAEPTKDRAIPATSQNSPFLWAVHRSVIPSSLSTWNSIHDVFSENALSINMCPGCPTGGGGAPTASRPPTAPKPPVAKPLPPVSSPSTGGIVVTGLPRTLYNPITQTQWDGTIAPRKPVDVEPKKGVNNRGEKLVPVPSGSSELAQFFQHSLVLNNATDSPFFLFWNVSDDRKTILFGMQTIMSGALPRWFGLGFGAYDRAHMRADTVFAVNRTVQDRMSFIEDEPVLDTKQSLLSASHTYYTFHGLNWQTAIFGRTVLDSDKDDRPIFLDKTNMITWAIGSGANDKHGASTVGAVWIDFMSGSGRQVDYYRDEVDSNVWKGVFIFCMILILYIGHKTIFTSRTLHSWHYEHFWLHYFKFSIFDIIVLLYWIVAVIAFTLIFMDTRKDVGIVFAVACELPAALIFISAIRIQFWDVIFDISYERQIRYHRWIAWTLFYLIAIHSWVTFAFWVIRGSLFDEFNIKEIVFGAVGGLQILIIAITATRLFRRHLWELFKWIHFTFILFGLWGALHEVKFLWFILPGASVWALDRLRRLWTWFGQPADILSVESSDDVTCIKFKKKNFEYRAGQFVFILLPQVSRLQLHPFSISSSPRDNFISVHAKPIGNYTAALKHLQENQSKSKIIVEGPYGFKPDWKSFDVVVLFGAGIGATPWISIVRDFLLDSDSTGPKYLYFILSVPNKSGLKWFDDTWQLAQQSANPALHIERYVTREKGSSEGDNIQFGRPDFNATLSKISQEFHGRTKKILVMSCGPGVFSRGVQDAAFSLSSRQGIIFEFHDEVFKF